MQIRELPPPPPTPVTESYRVPDGIEAPAPAPDSASGVGRVDGISGGMRSDASGGSSIVRPVMTSATSSSRSPRSFMEQYWSE